MTATEGGANGSYTVVLTSQPTDTVTVNVISDTQSSVSPTSLTFTTANWDSAQTVTVTAVDDSLVEGAHVGTISHTATSSDTNYNGISINNVTVNITDNDGAGVSITASSVTATEGGATGLYQVVLTSQPTDTVTVNVISDTQSSVSPTSLTFTTANWDSAQSVTVTAVDDSLVEGAHVGTISHTATSSDTNYNGISINNVTVNITDDDSAGVSITASSVTATEGGATGSYQVVLTSQPTDTVTVNVISDTQSSVSPTSLTFTTANWDSAQTVTVTAVDDELVEGAHIGTISHTATSSDTNYNGISINNVTVNITDDDGAGVSISPSSVTATEGGANGSYTVVLTSQPTDTVTVNVISDTQSSVSPTSLTFTTANWNAAQSVTVTAVDDELVEGAHLGTISHSATSSDTNYNGISINNVTVNITDDDSAGVSISPSRVTATEGGATGSYQVVLTSQPTDTVTVNVISDTQSSVSPTSLTFTTANWDSAQTVTVTAVDDELVEGAHIGTISHSATSNDTNYNGISINNVTVNITDDDSAGVSITASSVTATEGGATGLYQVVLTSQPTATVTVNVISDTQSSVSPTSLTFTTANWNAAQSVTVTAVDDELVEGAHLGTISHSATSNDTNYDGIFINNVTVNITDDDGATAVHLTELSGSTSYWAAIYAMLMLAAAGLVAWRWHRVSDTSLSK